ncbi:MULTISPECIES: type II secretion system minor pseudopilin GspK [unclassified Photobacterium]|uniref:type II secretion system minor pseudopilin GspK n=1 Tax=unclassified Photobacterium TaxID=2628852 RepID=UPI001EE0A79F|nr:MULTISPECIES: type II secretion system minor pseudopilin GspK [unclassified Photobacterium]MCG3864339.1 type II secretion system minor pseudopilin GspK [Photobacterium sp. Ph6]MCG3875869.1 type II secretion system minor pseudopilin GspK [Photobacterium sp. Ph5]
MIKKQRGVALIVVLLLVALMSLIAVQMTGRLQHNFHRVENQIQHQQAYWYSLGVEALAEKGLALTFKDSKIIDLSQPWAIEDQTYPIDGAVVTGSMFDKQACFNINALGAVKPVADGSKQPFLVTYFQNIMIDSGIDDYSAEQIADSSWEFIDKNTTVQSSYGGEDSTYEAFQPPYLPPNGWLADRSELRAINGVTADIYDEVKGLVCALPTDDFKLNVNTITEKQAVLLSALFSPELSLDAAKKIIKDRDARRKGWDSVDDFMKELPQGDQADKQEQQKKYLTVSSNYFSLDAEIQIDNARLRAVTLFKRDDNNKVTVVRRQYGGIRERISDDKTE